MDLLEAISVTLLAYNIQHPYSFFQKSTCYFPPSPTFIHSVDKTLLCIGFDDVTSGVFQLCSALIYSFFLGGLQGVNYQSLFVIRSNFWQLVLAFLNHAFDI